MGKVLSESGTQYVQLRKKKKHAEGRGEYGHEKKKPIESDKQKSISIKSSSFRGITRSSL